MDTLVGGDLPVKFLEVDEVRSVHFALVKGGGEGANWRGRGFVARRLEGIGNRPAP